MHEIEIFYLTGCPYCGSARRAVQELLQEEPAYGALRLRWIEENEEPALADSYDYYRVPALFHAGDKLYECSPLHGYDTIKARIRAAFDRVLAMSKLRYKCLVLDHDDTVMDSTRLIHHPAFLVYLKEVRPGTSISLEEYFRVNFHPGFLEYCENTLHLTPAELDREMEVWTDYVSTHVPRAFPGIQKIMAEQIRRGGSIAVISHSLRENILRDYRENGLPEPSMVFGWELPRELRKPDPYALDRLMACMDLAPEEMLVVDDLKPGYDMAARRRVPFAAAGWAYDVPEIRAFLQSNCPLYFDSTEGLYRYLFEEE